MGSRAVSRFGNANGAGAVGSTEEDNMAEAQLEGGPGNEGQQPEFKFKFGDKEFNSQDELTTHLTSLSTEITTLKATPPTIVERVVERPATVVADPNKLRRIDDMDSDEVLALSLSDPKAFAKRIREEVSTDLRTEYTAADQAKANMTTFWDTLWKEHPELKPFESTVKLVFNGNRDTLGPMKLDDARKKLGDLAIEAVTTINKDALKRGKVPPDPKAALEGGGNTASQGRQPAQGQQPQDTKPRSMTAMIQERAKARRTPPQRQSA